mgnify:CR=1 FL=1
MQSFTWFFAGAFFGGDFFSSTPNVGGGYTNAAAGVLLRGRKRTSTEVMLDRQKYGLDETLNGVLERWGRPKKRE